MAERSVTGLPEVLFPMKKASCFRQFGRWACPWSGTGQKKYSYFSLLQSGPQGIKKRLALDGKSGSDANVLDQVIFLGKIVQISVDYFLLQHSRTLLVSKFCPTIALPTE